MIEQPSRTRRQIPRGIWVLGFVSLLMDVSSEMIHALLPIYLVTVLGVSTIAVGLIEGIAEATASITRIFSGTLSDWLGRRKGLAIIGYGLAALTKPIFPLAETVNWIVGARFLDRVGKGIRGAPRDALIADISPPALRGASFGLRQSLDTVGAFLGPLLAIGLMALTANHFRTVFWVAVLPAIAAVVLLAVGVREPAVKAGPVDMATFRLADFFRLGRIFWTIVAIFGLFTLARFSEAFLVLRSQEAGMPITFIPLVLVIMSAVFALSAYPAGILSDRFGRKGILAVGMGVLILADLILAAANSITVTLVGIAIWGLHMGLTQGVFASLVADAAPVRLRGTAFGFFHLTGGIALLAASVAAGAIWQFHGPEAVFLTGAGFALMALTALLVAVKSQTKDGSAEETVVADQ